MSRASHDRPARVGAQVQQVIAERLAQGLKDPGLAGAVVTVTGVKMSPDLREARIYLSVFGSDAQKKSALAALERAKGWFKHEIAREMKLRLTPEIHFQYDESVEGADRLDRLLREVREKERW